MSLQSVSMPMFRGSVEAKLRQTVPYKLDALGSVGQLKEEEYLFLDFAESHPGPKGVRGPC